MKLKLGTKVLLALLIIALTGYGLWINRNKWQGFIPGRGKIPSVGTLSTGGSAGRFVVGGDTWQGYSIYRSPRFKKYLEASALTVEWKEYLDQAERFKAMAAGRIDIAPTTIDAYLAAGGPAGYPGVVVHLIDESDGGDGFVGGPRVKSVDDIAGKTVAFAANTPSEFLRDFMLAKFNINQADVQWKPVTDARDAYDLLKKGQVDAAILWEPYTSNAAAEIPGSTRILDTGEKIDKLIMDVAVVKRNLLNERKEDLHKFLKAYFQALEYYLGHRDEFIQFIAEDSQVPTAIARRILRGIDFINLARNNAEWLGLAPKTQEHLTRQIERTAQILSAVGKLSGRVEPLSLINDVPMLALKNEQEAFAAFETGRPATARPVKAPAFRPIVPQQVEQVTRKVGTLKVQTIYFPSGSADLDANARAILNAFAETMRYFNLYCRVDGHTDNIGDPGSNLILSQQRARAIVDYLINRHRFPRSQFIANGWGDRRPIADNRTEAGRSKNRRTEFILVEKR